MFPHFYRAVCWGQIETCNFLQSASYLRKKLFIRVVLLKQVISNFNAN